MKTDQEKIETIENFLKEAFCIDGECEFQSDAKVKTEYKTDDAILFSLHDSKRGLFKIALLK